MDRSNLDFAYGVHFSNGAIVMFFVIASLGDPFGEALYGFGEAAFASLFGGFPWWFVFLALFVNEAQKFLVSSCTKLIAILGYGGRN